MFIIIFGLIILVFTFGTVCYLSKSRYDQRMNEFSSDRGSKSIDISDLKEEFDRIDELQSNLKEVRKNVENLDIPTPKSVSTNDDAQSSLNKLSSYFEKHSLATVGTEQVILSLLPTSQIGQSIQSMIDVLPNNLSQAIFGDAIGTIKDSVGSLASQEGVSRFIYGMVHLDKFQMASMAKALEHHENISALLTPIKSGVLEAVGVHDATHQIAHSLVSIGSDMGSALDVSTSLGDLVDGSNIDFSGHIPVITIALSSIREIQLLADDKTTYLSSVKNIALDATGAGVGGAVGAKAGAIVGGVVAGPVGAILGGVLGAVGCAIGGRNITNKIKRIPLNNAIEAYENGYEKMKTETDTESRDALNSIKIYADSKRKGFKESEVISDTPVSDLSSIPEHIALILYQFVVNEMLEMKKGIANMRASVWFSSKKYESLLIEYETQIKQIECQLPTAELIKCNPHFVIDVLSKIKMPNRKTTTKFQAKINECRDELKKTTDKNNSSLLMWSYMINNLYQQTLNDIADFSNKKMKTLNELFSNWKNEMNRLQNKVEREKGKLGLN